MEIFLTISLKEMKKRNIPLVFLFSLALLFPFLAFCETPGEEKGTPILVYHRFGPRVVDSMTVTDAVFESHLKYLKENGYKICPLGELLDQYLTKGVLPDSRMVALTADDGHISIYTHALPLLKKYHAPMTLFLYPSAISNASYAMTWEQLMELKATGLFDFESHTYWHPNLKKDHARMKPDEYRKSVDIQLKKSKEVLEKKFHKKIDLLAWPFGIYDPWLEEKAAAAGYRAAFSIDRHPAAPSERRMAFPRYLMTNGDQGKNFERIAGGFRLSKN